MAMILDKVVPFGRSLDEYCKMFNLTLEDKTKKIIGVGDGPASFNAEMNQAGCRVISVDPIYVFTTKDIEKRFYEVVDPIIEQVKKSPGDWSWNYHKSPEDLRKNRIDVLNQFLNDYEKGKKEGRYRVGELPNLDFTDNEFDIALCSHLLFLYSEHLDYEFHLKSISEMLRIAREVRVFPLLTLMLKPSQHLSDIIKEMKSNGYEVKVEAVEYELQRGGNEMLVIKRDATNA
jgi:hypothetical protein